MSKANSDVSDRQRAANRANAAKSTGPKTEDGKNASRLNSLKHGLTAQLVCTLGEDTDAYDDCRTQYIEYFNPQSLPEWNALNRLVANTWRAERAIKMETALLDDSIDDGREDLAERYDSLSPELETALAFDRLSDGQSMQHIGRYESRLARIIRQDWRLLQEMIKNRPPQQNTILQNEAIPENEHLAQPTEESTTPAPEPALAATHQNPAIEPLVTASQTSRHPMDLPERPSTAMRAIHNPVGRIGIVITS